MKDFRKEYKRILKNIDIRRVIVYNSPSGFSRFYVERVNPDHVGIIWGKRRKCFGKGTSWVKVAKVFFSFCPVMYWVFFAGWVDVATGFMFNLVSSIGIVSLCSALVFSIVFYIPFVFCRREVVPVYAR